MKRKTLKPNQIERACRLIEYLRYNTDEKNKTTQAGLRKVPEIEEYIGYKSTFNDIITALAYSMNFNENDVKPEEEWKIVFDDFEKLYGLNSEDSDEPSEEVSMKIKGLYYRHTFSYEEINAIIESVLFSRVLDSESSMRLIKKIEKNLTTKFYRKTKNICTVHELQLVEKELLHNNLHTIQQAIDNRVQISFIFNGCSKNMKLEPVRKEPYTISPYYIAADHGKYYLFGCMDKYRKMSIWRIDLMSDIHTAINQGKPVPVLEKRNVEDLPLEWSDDFHLSHLNMSYDKPKPIYLKITGTGKSDYTFLHDWFGNNFRVMNDGVVRVVCSPFAMVNWALQYSDRVEVLEPSDVREQVIEKIKKLSEKYGID